MHQPGRDRRWKVVPSSTYKSSCPKKSRLLCQKSLRNDWQFRCCHGIQAYKVDSDADQCMTAVTRVSYCASLVRVIIMRYIDVRGELDRLTQDSENYTLHNRLAAWELFQCILKVFCYLSTLFVIQVISVGDNRLSYERPQRSIQYRLKNFRIPCFHCHWRAPRLVLSFTCTTQRTFHSFACIHAAVKETNVQISWITFGQFDAVHA